MIDNIYNIHDLNDAVLTGNKNLLDYLYVYFRYKYDNKVGHDGTIYMCGGIDADHPSLRDAIVQDLKKSHPQEIQGLLHRIPECITIEEAPWLNRRDTRQAKFIESLSESGTIKLVGSHFNFKINRIKKMDWTRSLIQQINYPNTTRPEKLRLLVVIKKQWDLTISFDRIFNWYKTDTQSKIETTWQWFQRNQPSLTAGLDAPQNGNDVKAIFDRTYENITLKENFLASIKDCHKNKKYYEKNKSNRTQFNLNVSPEIRDSIKEEAQIKNISPGRLIELLFLHAKQHEGLIDHLINQILLYDATTGNYLQTIQQPERRRDIFFPNQAAHHNQPLPTNHLNHQLPIMDPIVSETTNNRLSTPQKSEEKDKENRPDNDNEPNWA